LSDEAIAGIRYAYKASLIGAAHQFELTGDGLSWRIAGKSGVWPYAGIAAIRLSYRPVSMQVAPVSRRYPECRWRAHRHCFHHLADRSLDGAAGPGLSRLHDPVACAHEGSRQPGCMIGGLGPRTYAAAIALLVLVAIAMSGLFIRAIATGEFAGALFLVGFAALFAWQVGGFVGRNRPRAYTFDHLPEALLP